MGSQILTQEGHHVATAPDGDEALAYVSAQRPDIVLADTRMPGASGFDVCRHVKNDPALAHIRVVLLAGPLEPFDESEAQGVRCDGVLQKPLDAAALIAKIQSLLDESGGPSPEAAGGPREETEETIAGEALQTQPETPAARETGTQEAGSADGARAEARSASEPKPHGAAANEHPPAVRQDPPPALEETLKDVPAPALALQAAHTQKGPVSLSPPPPAPGDMAADFAAAVEHALRYQRRAEPPSRETVRRAVARALEEQLPSLVESVTERVMKLLDPR